MGKEGELELAKISKPRSKLNGFGETVCKELAVAIVGRKGWHEKMTTSYVRVEVGLDCSKTSWLAPGRPQLIW